jgi:hypothetical protein
MSLLSPFYSPTPPYSLSSYILYIYNLFPHNFQVILPKAHTCSNFFMFPNYYLEAQEKNFVSWPSLSPRLLLWHSLMVLSSLKKTNLFKSIMIYHATMHCSHYSISLLHLCKELFRSTFPKWFSLCLSLFLSLSHTH